MYYLNNKLNVLLLTPWLPTLVSSADNSQRLGSSHSYLEVVSEPLTFEFTPEKQPDRRQLLQAEEEDVIQNDEGWVWNSSSSLEDEEGHDVSSSLTSSSFFDIDQQATSSSEDDEAEDGGMELVGEPKEAISQPIARKLRRVGAPSDITKKESFRDESIPMVSSEYYCQPCCPCLHLSLMPD